MDHRMPLKYDTILDFEGMPCHVDEVVGQGSNAIVYRGWYPDRLHPELRHQVLIKELFPFHPNRKIWREETGRVVVAPEAQQLWDTHKESFEIGNEIHLRLLADHPDLMVMGANLNSFRYHGTLYTVLGYTGGRDLRTELSHGVPSLRVTAQRMIGLLDALEAFHKSGYLHLDISPDNVMLVGHGSQERMFLIDYNSARRAEDRDGQHLSCKAGYSAPEVSNGDLAAIGFASDLYSVAAVFYRCLMGRSLTLAQTLSPRAPGGQDSPVLKDVPQTVSNQVDKILKKGLHTLASRRYQSIGQMRQAFRELIDRIDCVGVTHWSLWENGKRSVEALIRMNPALGYLKEERTLYPIRLKQGESMSLRRYLDTLLSPEGRSGLILAQGGMGKTTLLLHTAMLQNKRYMPSTPAIFYISLNGWHGGDTRYIQNQILMRLRFKREENTYESAQHALRKVLEQPLKTKSGELPAVLLLLDGLNEIREDMALLVQEINELNALAGVRILAASRSAVPALALEAAELMPLDVEDIEGALGRSGLLVPQREEVLRLLRTPLILSIYVQASEGGKQLDIQSEAELINAYLDAMLEKELRALPEDAPQRWQIDAALNYVLPAIAAEMKRRNTALTERQLLRVVENCWKTLDSGAMRRAFPRWIGHSADIRAGADKAEQWYGVMIHQLLWQRLGMLIKDTDGGYRIFHQRLMESLSGRRLPLYSCRKRLALCCVLLMCVGLTAGAFLYQTQRAAALRRQTIETELKATIELGVCGYAEYGRLYKQLRELADSAQSGAAEAFQTCYSRTEAALLAEQKATTSEETEARMIADTSGYDQYLLSWGNPAAPYEYTLLSQLYRYPDDRADAYASILPVLKCWMESEDLQRKSPAFADAFSNLLEADANLAGELYHRSVGVHLTGEDTMWIEQINSLVAAFPELDGHRDTLPRTDRGQLVNSLTSAYLKQKGSFEAELAKVNAYIRREAQPS